jgi:hypothetical protein
MAEAVITVRTIMQLVRAFPELPPDKASRLLHEANEAHRLNAEVTTLLGVFGDHKITKLEYRLYEVRPAT